jgi:hypothetical protein
MGARIFKNLTVSFFTFFAFALVLATLALAYPRLVVNHQTLPWLGSVLRAYDIPVTWSRARASVESLSFLNKRITLEANNLCYLTAVPYRRVCLDSATTTFTFHLWSRKLTIEALDIPKATATVEAGRDSTPGEPFNLFSFVQQLREEMSWVQWNHVWLGNLALLYTDGDQAVRMEMGLEGVGLPRTLKLHTKGAVSAGGKRTPVRGTLTFSLPDKGPMSYALTGSGGHRSTQWSFGTTGTIEATALQGAFHADFAKPVEALQQVRLQNCDYQWIRSSAKNSVRLHCPNGALQIPAVVNAEVHASAEIDLSPQALQPLMAKIQTKVAQFEKIVPLLEQTPWAVPAPLNQLKGELELNTQTRADTRLHKVQTVFDATSLLASGDQSLHFTTQGSLDWFTAGNATDALLTADVEFQDTQLSLPRLDPVNMPRLFPDPRIVYPRSKSQSSFVFRDKVTIRTASGKPLLLRTNQYGALIPLELNLVHSTEDGLVGNLHTPPFQMEILRRQARVKSIDIHYPREGAAELNSTVEFHYQDFDLTLSAFGKLDSPRYAISSTPPLSENSAWSLLIFGRPLEELSSGQGESLVNARAAITGGAVSALSMYLLASTPVESVGYDPTRGKFMATVRLLEGTSLRIEGVKEGVSSLGIRKRLGRDWVLNTTIERSSPLEDKRSVSTFLDWSFAY